MNFWLLLLLVHSPLVSPPPLPRQTFFALDNLTNKIKEGLLRRFFGQLSTFWLLEVDFGFALPFFRPILRPGIGVGPGQRGGAAATGSVVHVQARLKAKICLWPEGACIECIFIQ